VRLGSKNRAFFIGEKMCVLHQVSVIFETVFHTSITNAIQMGLKQSNDAFIPVPSESTTTTDTKTIHPYPICFLRHRYGYQPVENYQYLHDVVSPR
jgi:hypothetical protein